MLDFPSRRDFFRMGGGALAAAALANAAACASWLAAHGGSAAPPFKISLAEWSLHRELRAQRLDHLDFARITRERYDIDAVEYVNGFFKDKATDNSYLRAMNQRAADHGVVQHLIMCDGEGRLGDSGRSQAP